MSVQKARAKAFAILARRDHTRHEMIEKLCRHFERDMATDVADRLCDEGYIDDEKIANLRVESYNRAHKSRRDAADRLRTAGIDREIIELCVEGIEELQGIEHLLRTTYRTRLASGERQKVFLSLQRKGFSVGNIKKALELCFDHETV